MPYEKETDDVETKLAILGFFSHLLVDKKIFSIFSRYLYGVMNGMYVPMWPRNISDNLEKYKLGY